MANNCSPDGSTPEKSAEIAELIDALEAGDCYDSDTGEFLATLDLKTGLPAAIEVYDASSGYWYIFKPDSRYKETKDPAVKAQVSAEMIELAKDLDKSAPSGLVNPT